MAGIVEKQQQQNAQVKLALLTSLLEGEVLGTEEHYHQQSPKGGADEPQEDPQCKGRLQAISQLSMF